MLPRLFSRRIKNQLTLGTRGLLKRPYRLDIPLFSSHIYTVGTSGSGKSSLLLHLVWELATKGWGTGVIDPHRSLAEGALVYLLTHRDSSYMDRPFLHDPFRRGKANLDKVIYVDPARTDFLIPANILKSSYANEYETTDNVIEGFVRVWPDMDQRAPRFEQILSNSLPVLAKNDRSIVELERFLTDIEFQMRLLNRINDPKIASFWLNQYARWGKERDLWINSVLNKVDRLIFTPQLRYMFGATENRLDFRRIIDEGKILLIDLGGFKKRTQRLIGCIFLTLLEQAVLSRVGQTEEERTPYYLVIDEFPMFTTLDVNALSFFLSESRKFRFYIALAHQGVYQYQGAKLEGALENARVKIAFGSGHQTAASISKELFIPDPSKVKHEIADEDQRERAHPLFQAVYEQEVEHRAKIQQLKTRNIIVKPPDSNSSVQLQTPTVYKYPMSVEYLEAVKEALMRRDGIPFARIKREVDQRFPIVNQPKYTKPVYYEPVKKTNGERRDLTLNRLREMTVH